MNGFLCVNKPRGPSSFKIISQLRRLLDIKKAGHCGTLDPQAEGLLVIAIGSSTRLLQYVSFEPKDYLFGLQFGSETDSFDLEGSIVASGGPFPTEEKLGQCLSQFTGHIKQTPPIYSAIKVNGTRAYKLARNGESPILEPKDVTISDLKLNIYNNLTGHAEFSLTCSSGTYVRSLVRDISHSCETFGTATFIKRTKVGAFSLEQAIDIDNTTNIKDNCIPAERIFRNEYILEIDTEQYNKIKHGQTLSINNYSGSPSHIFASKDGKIIAVLRNKALGCYHPETVLISEAI